MRRRWLLLALAFFAHAGVGAAAAGEPTSCAIRLATAPPARAGKSAALPALLADLPVPPLAARPLLAAPAPASGGGSAASTAVVAAATGPARHPFAAWQVLHFETAAALAAALPVLRRRADVLEVEPLRCMSLCASAAATHGSITAMHSSTPRTRTQPMRGDGFMRRTLHPSELHFGRSLGGLVCLDVLFAL